MNDILCIVVAGIFSCIILDILGYLLRLIGIPEPSWAIVGRWTYYMIKMQLFIILKLLICPNLNTKSYLGGFSIITYHYVNHLNS